MAKKRAASSKAALSTSVTKIANNIAGVAKNPITDKRKQKAVAAASKSKATNANANVKAKVKPSLSSKAAVARAPAGIVVGEGAAGKRLKPAAGMENASAGDGGGAGTGADSDEINPVTGVPEGMIMCGGVIYTGPDPRESGYPIGRYGLRYGRRMGR